jgi:hypothetical protein
MSSSTPSPEHRLVDVKPDQYRSAHECHVRHQGHERCHYAQAHETEEQRQGGLRERNVPRKLVGATITIL